VTPVIPGIPVIPGNDISNSRFPGICVPMTGMDSLAMIYEARNINQSEYKQKQVLRRYVFKTRADSAQ